MRPEPPWQGTVAKDGFSQLRMAWRAKDVAWRAKDSMAWRAKRAPTPKGCRFWQIFGAGAALKTYQRKGEGGERGERKGEKKERKEKKKREDSKCIDFADE